MSRLINLFIASGLYPVLKLWLDNEIGRAGSEIATTAGGHLRQRLRTAAPNDTLRALGLFTDLTHAVRHRSNTPIEPTA